MIRWCGVVAALVFAVPAMAQTIERVPDANSSTLEQALPMKVTGRTAPQDSRATATTLVRQWPGTYFETAFRGTQAGFRVGPGEMHLRVAIDQATALDLVKPAPGLYRFAGLTPGEHRVRVDVVNENQNGPTSFSGFRAGEGTTPLTLPTRPRQIEFIGDSHTVGYGNTSATRTCSPDEIWRSTDTSQGIGARIAKRFGADYQVNAISGRGIVRNYGGGAGDPVPVAYPYVLFDKARPYAGEGWTPEVIVVALGTNDFSTPLGKQEQWKTRDALHAAYEAEYVRFIEMLRARNLQARFVLWATDLSDGEIARETQKVVETLRAGGEKRIDFVPVSGLEMGACDWHPNTADDAKIAGMIAARIDAVAGVWDGKAAAAITPAQKASAGPANGAAATPAPRRGGLDTKLVNDPTVVWNVYGAQTSKVLPDGGPSGYPAVRVAVRKGANPWDAGAAVPMTKPISAGDVVMMAVYLRAPDVADGQTTPVIISLNQGAAPYERLTNASVAVGKEWKLYYASAKTGRAWTAAELVAGLNLAGASHTLDLGPVQVFDLGPDADLAQLPKN